MGWREILGLREPRRRHEQDHERAIDHDDRDLDDRGYPEVRGHPGGRGQMDDDYGRHGVEPTPPADLAGRGFRTGDVDESPDVATSGRGSLAEAPSIDAPPVEASPVEAPRVDAPSADAPSAEAPSGEAPSVEAPSVVTRREQPAMPPLSTTEQQAAGQQASLPVDVESFLRSPSPAVGDDQPAGFEAFEAPIERLGDLSGSGRTAEREPAAELRADRFATGRASDLGRERGDRLATHRDRYQEFLAADAEREEAARADAAQPAGPVVRPARPAPGAKPTAKRRETQSAMNQGANQGPAASQEPRPTRDAGRDDGGKARLASGGASGDESHPGQNA